MKRFLPHIIFIIAIFIFIGTTKGTDSLSNLQVLKKNHLDQDKKTKDLAILVADLKKSVSELENDPRALERAARNTQLLARPNEVVFLFNESKK